MTARDYRQYQARLSSLEGRKCFLSVACNSLKLHIDCNEKNGTYLRIDPPWIFGTQDAEIESSETCPDHHESDYKGQFKQWCHKLAPMIDNSIVRIESTERGRLVIFFRSGPVLCAPAIQVAEEDGLYDHWYVTFKDELQEKQQ